MPKCLPYRRAHPGRGRLEQSHLLRVEQDVRALGALGPTHSSAYDQERVGSGASWREETPCILMIVAADTAEMHSFVRAVQSSGALPNLDCQHPKHVRYNFSMSARLAEREL